MTASVLTRLGNGVASLTIASDAVPHVDEETISLLEIAGCEIEEDKSIRALVLEGGTRHFCSGGKRELLLRADAATAIGNLMGRLPRALLAIPVPTLAAMVGHALGGGLMFGLWCDLAFLGEESLYGANFLELGFTPGMGASALLEQLLGAPLASEMLLTGRTMKGRELKACAVPLSHAIGPAAGVRARTIACAEEIGAAPRNALTIFKRHLASKRIVALENALRDELAMHSAVFADPETHARILENYPTAVFGDSR